MAVAVGYYRLLPDNASLLRKSGQRVEFTEDADIGSAAAERTAKSCAYTTELFCYVKTICPQDIAVELCRFELLERKLRVFPYLVCRFREEVRHGLDRVYGSVFKICI